MTKKKLTSEQKEARRLLKEVKNHIQYNKAESKRLGRLHHEITELSLEANRQAR